MVIVVKGWANEGEVKKNRYKKHGCRVTAYAQGIFRILRKADKTLAFELVAKAIWNI